MKKLFICNTDIGKRGSVGERLGYVLASNKYNKHVIARSVLINPINLSKDTFNFIGRLILIANQLRLKIFPRLNTKSLDLFLFDFAVLQRLKRLNLSLFDTVYLTEISKKIVDYIINNSNCKIILDLPIAPLKYRKEIDDELIQKLSNRIYKKWICEEHYVFDNVDSIIVPSQFVYDEVLKYGIQNSKLRIVPFGTNILPKDKRSNVEKEGRLSVTFCGVLNSRKGIRYLLEAWKDPFFENHELVLCGRSTKYFDQVFKEFNFKNVKLLGQVDVYPILMNSHLYVFPSLMEGSSKSIYEAMAVGLPIICTKESGSIVVNNVNGLIIPKQDVLALRHSMITVLSDSDMRVKMQNNNLKDIINYSWVNYSNNISGLL